MTRRSRNEEYTVFTSSHLSEASYDPNEEMLEITFKNGQTYAYEDVDEGTWDGLRTASSAGKFFWRNIR